MTGFIRVSAALPVAALTVLAYLVTHVDQGQAGAVNVITVDSTAAANDGLCNDGDCTLREAVSVALGDGLDSIVTIPNLDTAAADIFLLNDGNTGIEVCDGCNVGTLEINGAGQGKTIIDMGDAFRGLDVRCDSCSVSVSNLTIRNGRLDGTGPGQIVAGAGVLVLDSGSNLTLTNVTVANNEATGDSDDGVTGVGIFNTGTLQLINSTVSGNFANYAPLSLRGAGIFNQGTLTVTGSTISGNSFFMPNNFNVAGGGISNLGGTVNITNSTISDNFVPNIGAGAGIYQEGTGIGQATGTTTVKSSTIANNTGPTAVAHSATVGFVNSMVYNPSTVAECQSAVTSNGNNLDRDGTCFGQPSDLHGNPDLGPLQNNGGATKTRALGLGSIAIDKGDDSHCMSSPIDQRGSPRIVGGDAALGKVCDIGAYEFRQTCRGLEATQVGNGAPNTITGGGGNDVIRGNGGNDNLKGVAGNDTICGDGGNDVIDGGNGQDKHDGGTATDTASFPGPTARTINLGTGQVSAETAAVDLFAIENVKGSDAGDNMTGNGGPNKLEGTEGQRYVEGGGRQRSATRRGGRRYLRRRRRHGHLQRRARQRRDSGCRLRDRRQYPLAKRNVTGAGLRPTPYHARRKVETTLRRRPKPCGRSPAAYAYNPFWRSVG